jgi:mono/diheme cytochrome c family protein
MAKHKLWGIVACLLITGQAIAGTNEARLARGKYLVEGVLACANCHGVRDEKGRVLAEKGMSGGFHLVEPMFDAYVPNITTDPETGIGKWTDAQLGKAIREGVRPDGSILSPLMPVEYYRTLSDDDLKAVILYLRAQPPVKSVVPKSTWNFPLPPTYGPPLVNVKAPSPRDKVAYGRYLITLGHCLECHTPRGEKGQLDATRLGAGGQSINGPWGESISRNITSHAEGLRDWSDTEIATAIRTGMDRSGKHYRPPMAFDWYHNISDADITAMIAYLRTLPPVESVAK